MSSLPSGSPLSDGSSEEAPQGSPSVPEKKGSPKRHLGVWLAALVALGGGLLALPAAAWQELFSGAFLVEFLAGPMIEEAMKPAGLYLLLAFRPQSLAGRAHTAFLAGLAGLAFGLGESTVYVTLYVEEPTASYALFRYTVPVILHVAASLIFSLGITTRLRASVLGQVSFLSGSWPFFIAAVALHSLYNIAAFSLGLAGWDFGQDVD